MGVLDGKAVIVTGAGRGLGAAYAVHSAEHGASVVVNDVDAAEAEQVVGTIVDGGGQAIAHIADVSSWPAAEGLVARCVKEFGRLDGLVNNAGIIRVGRPEGMGGDDYRDVISVNVLGSCYCGTHAMRHMVRQGSGAIVNVTSGAQAGSSLLAAYAASKGAIASLTYSWAIDLAGTGVRVNAISPMAETRMFDPALRSERPEPGQPAGPRPVDNAPVVVYLLSDESLRLNGQVVRVDGSRLSLMTHPSVLDPVLTAPRWSVETVKEAFRSELDLHVIPLGVRRVSEIPLDQ
jgi:NAD(P)-dependent dehydrogenase (short-subunit alcohol dehydrogenase family)